MFVLHIGNKNYSSWSMRSWVAMTAFGIPFEERQHWLDTPEFAAQLSPLSPVAKVPVLEDGDLRIWDSLAIGEYLAERFPELALWPQDVAERALARSLCASMHSGFGALREHMVMNIEADLPGRGWNPAVQRDIDQILRMWQGALQTSGGPFLFGAFGLVDAFYAPLCMRFVTYRPTLPDWAWRYVQTVAALPAMAKWMTQARAEGVFLPADEPYRAQGALASESHAASPIACFDAQLPYFAVIFSSLRSADDAGYEAMSRRMAELAPQQAGYLGIESVRRADGFGITVSYWSSLDAVARWKQQVEHLGAQALGKAKWYVDYAVRVARVERSYGKAKADRAVV